MTQASFHQGNRKRLGKSPNSVDLSFIINWKYLWWMFSFIINWKYQWGRRTAKAWGGGLCLRKEGNVPSHRVLWWRLLWRTRSSKCSAPSTRPTLLPVTSVILRHVKSLLRTKVRLAVGTGTGNLQKYKYIYIKKLTLAFQLPSRTVCYQNCYQLTVISRWGRSSCLQDILLKV